MDDQRPTAVGDIPSQTDPLRSTTSTAHPKQPGAITTEMLSAWSGGVDARVRSKPLPEEPGRAEPRQLVQTPSDPHQAASPSFTSPESALHYAAERRLAPQNSTKHLQAPQAPPTAVYSQTGVVGARTAPAMAGILLGHASASMLSAPPPPSLPTSAYHYSMAAVPGAPSLHAVGASERAVGDQTWQPPAAGADCAVAVNASYRHGRFVVFQRGRSCKAHPHKDTGSRDGFVVLSEPVVRKLANTLRPICKKTRVLAEFNRVLPLAIAGTDPDRSVVFSNALASMGQDAATQAESGNPAGARQPPSAAPDKPLRPLQDARSPTPPSPSPKRTSAARQGRAAANTLALTDLQLVLLALGAPGAFPELNGPLIRLGLTLVTDVDAPGCENMRGSLLAPSAALNAGSGASLQMQDLSRVAAAAGVHPEDVAATEAPTWGELSDAETLRRQEQAFRNILARAWPTSLRARLAPKQARGSAVFTPAWPKVHWRLGEACWVAGPPSATAPAGSSSSSSSSLGGGGGSGMVAVLPFTLAAMNHSGQPTHKPPASWLALGAVIGTTITRAENGVDDKAVEQSTGIFSALSQPFALVSCNDRPRALPSRNNRRLAFLPKTTRPDGAADNAPSTALLAAASERFVADINAHRGSPKHELSLVKAGLGGIVPREAIITGASSTVTQTRQAAATRSSPASSSIPAPFPSLTAPTWPAVVGSHPPVGFSRPLSIPGVMAPAAMVGAQANVAASSSSSSSSAIAGGLQHVGGLLGGSGGDAATSEAIEGGLRTRPRRRRSAQRLSGPVYKHDDDDDNEDEDDDDRAGGDGHRRRRRRWLPRDDEDYDDEEDGDDEEDDEEEDELDGTREAAHYRRSSSSVSSASRSKRSRSSKPPPHAASAPEQQLHERPPLSLRSRSLASSQQAVAPGLVDMHGFGAVHAGSLELQQFPMLLHPQYQPAPYPLQAHVLAQGTAPQFLPTLPQGFPSLHHYQQFLASQHLLYLQQYHQHQAVGAGASLSNDGSSNPPAAQAALHAAAAAARPSPFQGGMESLLQAAQHPTSAAMTHPQQGTSTTSGLEVTGTATVVPPSQPRTTAHNHAWQHQQAQAAMAHWPGTVQQQQQPLNRLHHFHQQQHAASNLDSAAQQYTTAAPPSYALAAALAAATSSGITVGGGVASGDASSSGVGTKSMATGSDDGAASESAVSTTRVTPATTAPARSSASAALHSPPPPPAPAAPAYPAPTTYPHLPSMSFTIGQQAVPSLAQTHFRGTTGVMPAAAQQMLPGPTGWSNHNNGHTWPVAAARPGGSAPAATGALDGGQSGRQLAASLGLRQATSSRLQHHQW